MTETIVTIVPTYNECENIQAFLDSLQKTGRQLKKYRFLILVVDDNSPDGTGKIVLEKAKYDKLIRLLSGPKLGLGTAMRRGIRYAIEKLNADIIVSTEADFAYSADIIPFAVLFG